MNMFTLDEIDRHKQDKSSWYEFVRNREVNILFSNIDNCYYENALEIGAGSGVQSLVISSFCKNLVCTDIDSGTNHSKGKAWSAVPLLERNIDNVDYKICNAEDLSIFEDKTFDLVYSGNVLVVINDLDSAISECCRVLKDNGIMIHVLPNRWWKLISSSLYFFKLRLPKVLGNSSNVNEFYRFGIKPWKKKFDKHSLALEKLIPLPFCTGHENTFIPVVKLGNWLKIPTSYAYVLKKKSQLPLN